MYDYYLGGRDSFPADRNAAARVVALFPQVRSTARANRRFLGRAVRFAARQGIRQFLDIGTGIPTADNTHQVAQTVAADARVVYVDNDPMVLSHARALLRGNAEGRTAFVDADFREPAEILRSPQVTEVLDFSLPVALMVVSLLHFVPAEDRPEQVLRQLKDALAPGSALILSHATDAFTPPEIAAHVLRTYTGAGTSLTPRSHREVLRFFDGLDLVEPGLVPVHRWRTEDAEDLGLTSEEVAGYAGVALKPGPGIAT